MRSGQPLKRVKSLLGEFVVIVAGVLTALAVDHWKDVLDDRQLEAAYVDRLRADLQADTARLGNYQRGVIAQKAGVLTDMLSDDVLARLSERPDLMAALSVSTWKGLPESRSVTFDEIQSTGALNLLRDAELRGLLSGYYSGFDQIARVWAEPDGDYQVRLGRALPGDQVYEWAMSQREPDREKLIAGLRELFAEPGLVGAVNSELEYTAMMGASARRLHGNATDLLLLLEGS